MKKIDCFCVGGGGAGELHDNDRSRFGNKTAIGSIYDSYSGDSWSGAGGGAGYGHPPYPFNSKPLKGGDGGSDGGDGSYSEEGYGTARYTGSHHTTRYFGESNGTLYAGGGGGAGIKPITWSSGSFGAVLWEEGCGNYGAPGPGANTGTGGKCMTVLGEPNDIYMGYRGGLGGRCATVLGVSVTPGSTIPIVVGSGVLKGDSSDGFSGICIIRWSKQ